MILILLTAGAGTAWYKNQVLKKWQSLAGSNPYNGYFTTPQAVYLYGHYSSQLVVMAWGSVCESYPDRNYGGEIALLHLAQHPGAARILILGQGSLPVCAAFLELPQVQQVTWLTQDAEYSRKLLALLQGREAGAGEVPGRLENLEIPAEDIYLFIKSHKTQYDLVILHFPAASTQVLNSFYTKNFYRKIKEHLAPGGVVKCADSRGRKLAGCRAFAPGHFCFRNPAKCL